MTNSELVQSVLEVSEMPAGPNTCAVARGSLEPAQPSLKLSCKENLIAVETLLYSVES